MKKITPIVIAMVMAFTSCFILMGQDAYAADDQKIGTAKAKAIALKNAKLKSKQVRRMKAEYDSDDSSYEVEFIKKKNKAKYEYEIHHTSGKILKRSIEYKYKKKYSSKKIGKKKARKKAAKVTKTKLSIVKKGTCKFKKKRSGSKYEIKFTKGDYRHEVEILARNGKVIEREYRYVAK